MSVDVLQTDVLVVGTGGAGLRAAVEAARAGVDVLVVSKLCLDGLTCTVRAWGGFSYSTPRTEEELFRQVVVTGGFLNNQRLLEAFTADVPRELARLAELGVEFDEPMLSGSAPDTMPGIRRLRAHRQSAGQHGRRDCAGVPGRGGAG